MVTLLQEIDQYYYQCASPAPNQKFIKTSTRQSYLDVLFTMLMTFEAGGGRGESIEYFSQIFIHA